jgi:glycosyltransferase involved in cell wall biosynthesis
MRIGLVVPGFSADTTDWCIPALRHLTEQLAQTDEVHVFAVRYPYRAARYRVGRADVTAIGGARRRGWTTGQVWRRTVAALIAEHRRRPFDVFHAFWATESGLLTALAAKVLRRPGIVSLAGGELVGLRDIGYGDQLSAAQRLKVHASMRLADLVTAGSSNLLALAGRSVPAARLRRAPLGVDTRLFQAASSWPAEPRLVHVGALTPVKDQATLLGAFAALCGRLPSVTLDIVGDGPLRAELGRLAVQLRVDERVRFTGQIAHDALPGVYQAGTVFALSSRHEAQGMVALEAAACGRPVVGTHVGVVPEVGESVAIRDAEALAGALTRACEEAQHAQRLAVAGRQLVDSTYSLDRAAAGFRALYAAVSG